MALIYKNVYQSKEVSVVKSSAYIEEMVHSICNSNEDGVKAEVFLELEEVDMDLDKAIPIGMIINELTTNSIKYAFEQSNSENKLIVRLSYDENSSGIHLSVSDNGKGIADLHQEEPSGYGLTLVRGLTSQLGGKINIKTQKNRGTSVDVQFGSLV